MRSLLISLLQKRARKAIDTFNPTIVAITGSVGKTSAKKAIDIVLASQKQIRSSQKNYNNEIGVPLSILGMESPGRSVIGWLRLLWRAGRVTSMPEVLILEFGADHPGDIQALCDLAPPTVAVVTGISPVHAAFFLSMDELVAEKAVLVERVPQEGLVVLNADDRRVMEMATKTTSRIKTFGLKSEDIGVRNIRLKTRDDEHFDPGELFSLTTADVVRVEEALGELMLRNTIGYAPVMACLAAIAVGSRFDIAPADAIKALNESFGPEPGRLNPLAGVKGSLIIDDSYNAAPAAMMNGLSILQLFTPGEEYDRRIAVLGSMAELGAYTEDEHRMVGLKAAEACDLLIVVGEDMQAAVTAAKEAGMDGEHVEWFENSIEAGRYLDRVIQEGDIVYVKGSQSSRMERVVKDIMAEPLRAAELLVRQEEKWLSE